MTPTATTKQATAMAKPFDYSKWDNIELSDDEEDVHPNIDRESWFRMKHRSRVEREDHTEKDKAVIVEHMEAAGKRITAIQYELKQLGMEKAAGSDDDSDDDWFVLKWVLGMSLREALLWQVMCMYEMSLFFHWTSWRNVAWWAHENGK